MTSCCPRYLHSIYCDDVRAEVGGKMTFVGVYQSQLIFEQPGPIVVPRLCVVATAQTPKNQPFSLLRFKLMQDDVLVQEIAIPDEGHKEVIQASIDDVMSQYHSYGAIITLQPFVVEKSCRLRVIAETEAGELKASALRIVVPEKPEETQS